MHKRILVTGSSGVVGGALQDIAPTTYRDHDFIFSTSKQCDLTNLAETVEYVRECNVDAILHLAAVSGGIQLSMEHPATVLRDNVLMNLNIMEAARLNGVKKTVMTLSTGIYPAKAPTPLREECMHDGYPHESNYSYSFAKRLVDPMIRAYRKEYGMNVIGLIPNAILGPRSNFDYKSSTVIPALIRRFYENREGNEKIVVWGDGTPSREVTSSWDVARAFMWCLGHYDDVQCLNIGTTERITVKEAAYLICETLKIDKSRILFDSTKPTGAQQKDTDNSKFLNLSRFKYMPISETIRKTIEYFVANYPNPHKLRLNHSSR